MAMASGWSRTALGLAVVAALARPALGQGPPIDVPPEDRRTHARIARSPLDASVRLEYLLGGGGQPDLAATWLQVGLGPFPRTGPGGGPWIGGLDVWAARARFGLITPVLDRPIAGPITLAVTRFVPLRTLDIPGMLNLEGGLELAASSPWLGDAGVPGPTLRALHGPDAEVADSGWDLRPVVHGRADLRACRSWHAEGGFGGDVFRSTIDDTRGWDTALVWYGTLGAGLCLRRRSVLDRFTLAVEHRARAFGDAGAYRFTSAAGLRFSWSGGSVALTGTNGDFDSYWKVGLQLTLGLLGGAP